MSSTTGSTTVVEVKRPNLINSLFPSVVSGIVFGVVGAAIAGVLVNRITTAGSPDGVPNDDAVTAAVYTFWVLFFFIGIGAFNGIFNFSDLPVRFITRLGVTTIVLSLVYIFYILVKKFMGMAERTPGHSSRSATAEVSPDRQASSR